MNTPEEITTIQEIQQLVINGFTDWKRYGEVNVYLRGDLLLFNYTQTAQFAARWNFFERVSRGLIINHKTGEIVARPFDKFYNYLEGGRRGEGHIVNVTEKADGSLAILFREHGKYHIATRGRFDSPQAQWATAYLHNNFDLTGLPDELTLLFEIIYPGNRIVVDYKDREDLVLLAARNRFTGNYLPFFPDLYTLADNYGFTLPQVYQFNNILDIVAQTGVIDENQEGWVVEYSDGSRFKIKGDRYRELHKLLSGLTFKNVLIAMSNGTVNRLIAMIPDEFLRETKTWIAEIQSTINDLTTRAQAAYKIAPRGSRKEFAEWVQANHRDLSPYLFALYDEKELAPLIYKYHRWEKYDDPV